jgi:hypothetical protein
VFRLITCVTAACDDCGATFEDDDYGILHWNDQDEATRWLTEHAGWRTRAGGMLTCSRCAVYQECATYGHLYEPWTPCQCGGLVATHTTVPTQVCTQELADRVGRCPCVGRNPGHTSVQIEMCTHQFRYCERCLRAHRRRTRPIPTPSAETPHPEGNL